MKLLKAILVLLLLPCIAYSQNYIDTLFQIQTINDIQYGTAVDFAGTSRDLKLDISVPIGDSIPQYGRPLMVIIHGGAWLVGDKGDLVPKMMREDFAKRGYTTASINYRLGQFNTSSFVNCNISTLFNVTWNCLQMADTAEWYRANHRGIQDANGAIRFLVNNRKTYNIDSAKIFVVGESAGGFIAMGVGFIDDSSEVQFHLVDSLPSVAAPNALYESSCIQAQGLATSIASMDLTRPNLGGVQGSINFPPNSPYEIKGVGNFYGGVYQNIFHSTNSTPPALYMFHQPCDLIVPYNFTRLASGYQGCFFGGIANCGYIYNRPFVYGSKGIQSLLDTMNANNVPTPDYLFDNTANTWDCLAQAAPGQVCHSIDNYWLRTTNMAVFFASRVVVGVEQNRTAHQSITIYPNPASSKVAIKLNSRYDDLSIVLYNQLGQVQIKERYFDIREIELDVDNLSDGVYYISITSGNLNYQKKILIY